MDEYVIRWYGDAWDGADNLAEARGIIRATVSDVRKGLMPWFLCADDIDPDDPYMGFSITEHDPDTDEIVKRWYLSPSGRLIEQEVE